MHDYGRIGFIGLGIMGSPMAKNLLKAGHRLVVFDMSAQRVTELVALGAEKADSARGVAEKSDRLIVTMLPDSPQVREVVCGAEGILKAGRKGLVIADTSSISPVAAKEIGEAAADSGVRYLDCPVSGGEPKATDATLSIMCGGEEEAFELVRPVLSKMGSSVTLVGGIGSGSVTKLANQVVVAMNIAALGEAFTLAVKAGTDPAKVFDAIKSGLAGSTVMNAKVPMILQRNFQPGFRMELHIKDLKNAVSAAEATGVEIPLTREILSYMERLREEGLGKADHCGLVRYYEKISDTEIR